ncbi:hypothetical protein AB1Y20_005841 [Prymnesium parvum]|uniref:peptidylprolyl isomerase n=1 Tax=Prymnesium parvum TaxID=97485 RepID=A0AB34J2R0_PRYPA
MALVVACASMPLGLSAPHGVLPRSLNLRISTPPLMPTPVRFAAPAMREQRAALADGEGSPVTSDGGIRKWTLQEGGAQDEPPTAGALVRVLYTCARMNGTMLDSKHAEEPLEFQLGAGDVVDGLERGVRTMRVGERAAFVCTPRWVHGATSLDGRIPTDAPLRYEVELLGWEEGPPLESEDEEFDLHTYRTSLEGKAAAAGRTVDYTWTEEGEEVTLWFPVADSVRKPDVRCEFSQKHLRVWVGDEPEPRASGELKGRALVEDCYWVFDDYNGGRCIQVVLAKAGAFTCWDGVYLEEQNLGV